LDLVSEPEPKTSLKRPIALSLRPEGFLYFLADIVFRGQPRQVSAQPGQEPSNPLSPILIAERLW
jgi:hypothetical protein